MSAPASKRGTISAYIITTSTLVLIVLVAFIAVIAAVLLLPGGIDWHNTYRPAARSVLEGRSPYEGGEFYCAPWATLPLLPFAILPEAIARGILFWVGVGVYVFVARRLGAGLITTAAFIASPPVVHCLLNANIDWLALVGVVLPPQIGLFFLVIKPQIGVGVAVFWFIDIWRRGGLGKMIRTFAPVTVALLGSFLVYELWPLRLTKAPAYSFNASLWPVSIPAGLLLLAVAVRTGRKKPAVAASPFLSPYVLFHSWVGVLASMVSNWILTVATTVALWVLVIVRLTEQGQGI
jgi:hypothetical protein